MTVDLNVVEIETEVVELKTEPAPLPEGIEHYQLIIFDKDGTIAGHKDGSSFVNHHRDQVMLPYVVDVCKQLDERGIITAVASNQGGVAFGYMTLNEASRAVLQAAHGVLAVTTRMCPFHIDGGLDAYKIDSPYRKPQPGMLTSIMDETLIDPEYVMMVGDRNEDLQAANRAGIEFMWAWQFFGWGMPDDWEASDEDHGEGHLGDD